MNLLKPLFIDSLKKYRIIHPETIARAMKILANNQVKKNIFLSDEIEKLAK
jgi:hypothetical protein